MPSLSRRSFLSAAAGVGLGAGPFGWLPGLARALADAPGKRRQCILLWMNGGPSTIDLWDMKPGHENGGSFRPIDTSVPGMSICEHLPKLARQAEHLALVRSLSTKEGDHGRGTYLMRTGRQPTGPIRYPTLGSFVSHELGSDEAELPNFVSISPYTLFNREAFGPGFLGPRHAALTVGATDAFVVQQLPQAGQGNGYAALGVDDLRPAENVSLGQQAQRLAIWNSLQEGFLARHRSGAAAAHNTVYQRAMRMAGSESARAFALEEEPPAVRDAYGKGRFGQGCLMARRLIDRGVPFVEVTLGGLGGGALGWDTHFNHFSLVKPLMEELDAGWSTLLTELKERGLLESTTILWMGEFGRTPKINPQGGRDHYPAAWSAVLAGGGVRGGQVFGRTSADGMTVEEGKVDVGDLLATLCRALRLDPAKQNLSEIGRPIALADGRAIETLVG